MELIYALQEAASPALDRFMMLVTNLGSEQVYVALLVLAYVVVDARFGRTLAIIFMSSMYLNAVLKVAFTTQRPFEIDPTVARSPAAVDTAPGHGFPSGHAQGAMTFWGAAAVFVRRHWFTVLAAVVVGAVAVSRLYLGVHMPIDVIGGMTIGLIVISVGVMLQRSNVRLARPLVIVIGLLGPIVLQLLVPLENAGVLLGGLAAFAVGPELVRHETRGPLAGRAILGVIALGLVFAALMGSSALLSEGLKRDPIGEYLRYLVIGLVGTVLAPLLGRVTGLTPAMKRV